MRARPLLVTLVATCSAVAFTAAPADAAKRRTTTTWAPAATAAVHPGVMTYTDGAQCTANFVYTDGCDSGSLPLGTKVEVDGSDGRTYTGTMVYNSWLAMQTAPRETDPETCAYNDLALIELPADAVAVTNPSVPFFGGPTALGAGTAFGDDVWSYGNSSLRLGLSPLSPKQGTSLGDSEGGWSTTVYTVTPGIPGDSGSGFLDPQGRAFGVLSTVAIAPLAGSNGVGNLAKELAYAQSHGVPGLALVPGTEAFSPGLV